MNSAAKKILLFGVALMATGVMILVGGLILMVLLMFLL